MRLLVNALSIGSLSGEHVVYGFLRPLCRWLLPSDEMLVLHYEGQPPPTELIEAGVRTIALPTSQRNWLRRTVWEVTQFPKLVRQHKADVVLGVSGALTPGCPVPQVALAQNPWCYVPAAQHGWKDRAKARLQRSGYRNAFRNAAMMIYISSHLRDLYRRANTGTRETRSEIAYVGLNEETYQAARSLKSAPRDPLSILSVSAFAPWKGVETVVKAVELLRERGIPATLKLVGPWPNSSYENSIRKLIADRQLDDAVQIFGKVSADQLHQHYATSQVFCLMSSCESFGIPAAEAMAFGTPIVSTDCCAIAEICEGSGLFGPVNDPMWAANSLDQALSDPAKWLNWSQRAVENAARLTWEQCAKPFQKIPELLNTLR